MTPEATTGAGSHLVECYEQLREELVSGLRGHGLGLALFLREGMAAWMRACSTWLPASAPRPRPAQSLPIGVRGEMAALLAEMALASVREARA